MAMPEFCERLEEYWHGVADELRATDTKLVGVPPDAPSEPWPDRALLDEPRMASRGRAAASTFAASGCFDKHGGDGGTSYYCMRRHLRAWDEAKEPQCPANRGYVARECVTPHASRAGACLQACARHACRLSCACGG